jgi:hypothetical protein
VTAGISIAGATNLVGNSFTDFYNDEPATRGFLLDGLRIKNISNFNPEVLVAAISLTGVSQYEVINCELTDIFGGDSSRGVGASNTKDFRIAHNFTARVAAGNGTSGISVSPSAIGVIEHNTCIDNFLILVPGVPLNFGRSASGMASSNSFYITFDQNHTSNTYIPRVEGFEPKRAAAVLTRGALGVIVRNHNDSGTRNRWLESPAALNAAPAVSYDHRSLDSNPVSTSPFTAMFQNLVSVSSDVGIQLDGTLADGLSEVSITNTKIYFSSVADLRVIGTVTNLQQYNNDFGTTEGI